MTGWIPYRPNDTAELVARALLEDLGPGDLTSSCFAPEDRTLAYIEGQKEGILCGLGLAAEILSEVSHVECFSTDGQAIKNPSIVLRCEGPTGAILSRERVVLNFLMHLSGIASLTAQFVKAIEGTHAKIVDTRKTTPGLRSLEKYAVRCGGGTNHRLGLYDAVMIKDNHIAACGSIEKAVLRVSKTMPHTAMIEVETTNESQVKEAIFAGANIVMLDNMNPSDMATIVAKYGNEVRFEASGGITLENVREVAETGVHLISVGALTHSAPALPLHLEVGKGS